jgi:hypothetical protein
MSLPEVLYASVAFSTVAFIALRPDRMLTNIREGFTARSSCQRRYAPMVFGIIPECRSASLRNERSASPESPTSLLQTFRAHPQSTAVPVWFEFLRARLTPFDHTPDREHHEKGTQRDSRTRLGYRRNDGNRATLKRIDRDRVSVGITQARIGRVEIQR